jgi:soluble cytochrome b562
MKIRTFLFGLTLPVLMGTPVLLNAQPPASPPAHDHGPEKPETELEGKMSSMNRAFRKLRRQITDAAQNDESLKLVAQIKQAGEDAVKLIPAKAADLPEAERAQFVADYQKKMKSFLGEVDKLEAALKAGNNENAAKIVAELGAMQKEDHRAFRKPD